VRYKLDPRCRRSSCSKFDFVEFGSANDEYCAMYKLGVMVYPGALRVTRDPGTIPRCDAEELEKKVHLQALDRGYLVDENA
jgi:hypothetical protein